MHNIIDKELLLGKVIKKKIIIIIFSTCCVMHCNKFSYSENKVSIFMNFKMFSSWILKSQQYSYCTQYTVHCTVQYTVPKVIDFTRYNKKCSGGNVILHGIFHVVSRFLYISCYEYIAEIWIAFLTVHVLF